MLSTLKRRLILLLILFLAGLFIALPDFQQFDLKTPWWTGKIPFGIPAWSTTWFGKTLTIPRWQFKRGLDIQGGIQVVLRADMSKIETQDRENALASARDVILRRVDMYGINEPVVRSAKQGDDYRVVVELPGVTKPEEALALVGKTAQLEFMLVTASASGSASLLASPSAQPTVNLQSTGLNGSLLRRSSVQFDQKSGDPIVSLEFNSEGAKLFGDVTSKNVGQKLAIFLDGVPIMAPTISTPILDGQAVITGQFTIDEAKQLAIQLNAGALPVPIQVLEQKTVEASLGNAAVARSAFAGVVGLILVIAFMVIYYGKKGFIAGLALTLYAVLTFALYKILGVTLTVPGIAGLLLTIGMAVDANILIFERMKEEERAGRTPQQALDLGFGRAWDSIKDANAATILTALVLINPFNFSFLNSSGLVKGFGITLLIGVLLSLFTGVFVSRSLMQLAYGVYQKVHR